MNLQIFGSVVNQAFTPAPPSPPLDEARLDDWAMTSLSAEDYPRPQVSYCLRGVVADDTVSTWFCWRADLNHATSAEDAEEMARAIPIASRELAQVNTLARGKDLVKKIAEHSGQAWVVILSPSGEWQSRQLADLAEEDDLVSQLAFATVYLPAASGGLSAGLPDTSMAAFRLAVPDAVDENVWIRVLLRDVGDAIEASRLLPDGDIENLGIFETDRAAMKALCQAMHAKRVHVSGSDVAGLRDIQSSTAPLRIAYLQKRTTQTQTGGEADLASLTDCTVQLRSHLELARAVAIRLTQRLGLEAGLADVIVEACERHDAGKNRRWWQAAIGNEVGQPLAKSGESFFNHDLNAGYRHEFGSLLEAAEDPRLANHTNRELILHLIAAHHGWGRPSFEPAAYDRSRPASVCEEVAHEAALRFARLQRRYGWWQLAFLEALVKCVDAIASANPNWTNP